MQTRMMLVSGAIGVGLLAATILQARGMAARAAAPGAAPVSRGVAAEGRVITYPGSEVVVGAERAGRLVRVLVDEGQSVTRGALLAELESDELRAGLDESRARVTETEAELRLADANLKRRRELVEQKIVAANDLDHATRDVETARARLETARATVARQEAQLRKSRILAPLAGTVIARTVQPGEMIEVGQKVVTLANLSRLRVEGEADEADAAALAVGAPVTITCDGYPGRSWNGRIEDVADSVTIRKLKPQDPGRPTDTRVLAVKVAFTEPTPLKLGATVELRVITAGPK
jgi:HlyD family secretion protein